MRLTIGSERTGKVTSMRRRKLRGIQSPLEM